MSAFVERLAREPEFSELSRQRHILVLFCVFCFEVRTKAQMLRVPTESRDDWNLMVYEYECGWTMTTESRD